MADRIAGDRGELKHNEEIGFFNRLIIDLKLMQKGRPPTEPITMDRLEEGTKMIDKLFQCRERRIWR